MNISGNYGAMRGMNFDPQAMRANFGKMKENMRAQNPEMAEKMDKFESIMDGLKEKGSFSMEDIKNAAQEAGLPQPSGMDQMPGGGMPSFLSLMKGQQQGGESDARARVLSNYGANGQGVQNSLAQSLIDLMS